MDIIGTREAIVLGPMGRPLLDMDPVTLCNNGDVASAWDARLGVVLGSMAFYARTFNVAGLRLVWEDTRTDVMVECPSCESITSATNHATVDNDDCVVCHDCI